MYTNNTINPTASKPQIGLNDTVLKRPKGFAIIEMRNPEGNIPILSNNHIENHTGQPLSPTVQNDIMKIINHLKPQSDALPILSKNTDNNLDKSKQLPQDLTDNDVLLPITTGLAGVVAGMIIHNKLNPVSNNIPPIVPKKKDLTENMIKMMPDMIKAVSMGITMIATSIGLSYWFNQESPERLKIKLDAAKK
jgi:hypothetical protein